MKIRRILVAVSLICVLSFGGCSTKQEEKNKGENQKQEEQMQEEHMQEEQMQEEQMQEKQIQEEQQEQQEDKIQNEVKEVVKEVAEAVDKAKQEESKKENTVSNEEIVEPVKPQEFTYEIQEISPEIESRITGISYPEGCEIPLSSLRYIKLSHYDFEGNVQMGELIVNEKIASDIVSIFEELFAIKYPIEKMKLIDEYNANDSESMKDNNTSAFNYRKVAGTDRLSKHSYGRAIDINPLYNPYIRTQDGVKIIDPIEGEQYTDRTQSCFYYIHSQDVCDSLFKKYGFAWGGDWTTQKDYQHFEKQE